MMAPIRKINKAMTRLLLKKHHGDNLARFVPINFNFINQIDKSIQRMTDPDRIRFFLSNSEKVFRFRPVAAWFIRSFPGASGCPVLDFMLSPVRQACPDRRNDPDKPPPARPVQVASQHRARFGDRSRATGIPH